MDSTVSTSDGTSKTADRTTLRGAFARFEHSEFLSPRWMRLGASGLRCLHWPIAAGLHLLVQATAIVPLRRYLSPFLSSRIIIDGCGHLDTGGKYWLGAKATSITHLIGFGRYWGERPIFVVGHWLEGICSDRLFSLRHWRKLFARRQRIQISLGDSTPSDHVEYLRIGMTCLVLDLIEQRPIHALPQLRDPVAALERFAGDPMLMQTVPDRAQHRWTAVELHRVYARAVRDMLLSRDNPPEEAWRILHAWQSTLDHLEDGKSEAESQRWLLGRVDWLSKKWLMEQLGTPTSWNAKKKVDIRYHELSPHGYCRRFWRALQIEPLVEPAEVARARRVPPAGTPAAKRGYYIREFAECDEFRVDWDSVEFRDGGKRQSISLG